MKYEISPSKADNVSNFPDPIRLLRDKVDNNVL